MGSDDNLVTRRSWAVHEWSLQKAQRDLDRAANLPPAPEMWKRVCTAGVPQSIRVHRGELLSEATEPVALVNDEKRGASGDPLLCRLSTLDHVQLLGSLVHHDPLSRHCHRRCNRAWMDGGTVCSSTEQPEVLLTTPPSTSPCRRQVHRRVREEDVQLAAPHKRRCRR